GTRGDSHSSVTVTPRQIDRKHRTAPELRLKGYRQRKQPRQSFHDGKPQPQSSRAIALRISQLVKLLEHGVALVLRYAWAGVVNGQTKHLATAATPDENLAP